MFPELPVFGTELFTAFKEAMWVELEMEQSPLDMNPEKVLARMSQWQSLNHQALNSLRQSVASLATTVSNGFNALQTNAKAGQEASGRKLAFAFINAARELVLGKQSLEEEEEEPLTPQLRREDTLNQKQVLLPVQGHHQQR